MQRRFFATIFLVSLTLVPWFALAQIACEEAPVGLVAWWPGDQDGSDIAGGNYDATLNGDATAGLAAGQVGSAFEFDGVNDSAPTPFLVSGSQFTVVVWAQSAGIAGLDGLFGTFGIAGGNDRFWLTASVGNLLLNAGNQSVDDLIGALPAQLAAGAWTHLAATADYTAGVVELYVDGESEGQANITATPPTMPLYLGTTTGNFGQTFPWNGRLDEVQVYGRVLGEQEIMALYEAGADGVCRDGFDLDSDGVRMDACPDSDKAATVEIGDCDSGVENTRFPNGCFLTDTLAACDGQHGCLITAPKKLAAAGVLDDTRLDGILGCVTQ